MKGGTVHGEHVNEEPSKTDKREHAALSSVLHESAVGSNAGPAEVERDVTPQSRQRLHVQAKLAVGPSDDPMEREADRMAERVVRSLASRTVAEAPSTRDTERPVARRIQRAPGTTTVGLEGGNVDTATERSIQSARGGGKAMRADDRSRMEGAFGADFSGVRIHEGSQASELNDRIQAKAFTTGSDIFFRDGMPDTSSAAGQRLVAHELTHVVQQGGAVQRSDADSRIQRSAAPTIQRKVSARSTRAETAYEITAGALGTTHQLPAGAMIEVDDTDTHVINGVTYGRVTSAQQITSAVYVDMSIMPSGPEAGGSLDTALMGMEVPGAALEAAGVVGEIGEANKYLGSNEDLIADAGLKGRIELAGDGVNIGSGFFGLAQSIMVLKNSAGREDQGWDRADAAMDLSASATTAGAGIAGAIDKAKNLSTENNPSDAARAAAGLAGFGDIFAGIKATFGTVKSALDLYQEAKKGDKGALTGEQKLQAVTGIITNLLEVAKSGVSAAKNFLDAFTSGASAAFAAVTPGFGVALGAAELVVRTVSLIKSAVSGANMKATKRDAKGAIDVPAEFAPVVGPDGVGAKGADRKGKTHPARTAYQRLQKTPPTPGSVEERFVQWADNDATFQQYLLSKGVQYINKKRSGRAIYKIGVAMTKMGGDVATLGGASAPVGIGLKAGASLVDAGFTVFRNIKQHVRDKNPSADPKSTANKLKGYHRQVDRIFDMIVKASALPDTRANPTDPDPRFAGAVRILDAIGIAPKRAIALKDDPATLRAELIEQMKVRD